MVSAGSALNVCLVSQSYLPYHGGISEHVWHLAAGLSERGHRVSILTGKPFSNGYPDEPDPPGVEVIRLGRTVRVPSNGGRACVTLGLAWGRRLRDMLISAPDVFHIQSPLEPLLPLWALHHLPGLKIGTFHTGGERPHWGYRRFSPWLSRSVDRLARRLTVSREAARYVADHFPGKYDIVPNGVDLQRFKPAETLAERDELRVLFVGRLDPRKGLRRLLVAFDHARKAVGQAGERGRQRPQSMRLVIVGDGPERAPLERIAHRRMIPVDFRGVLERRELPDCYAQADIFVASATDGESFGVCLLEAMASGLPVIASAIRGYRETLDGSGAARHCAPGSVADLTATLRDLAAHPETRAAMGRAGRRFVQRYAWDRIVEQVEGIYYAALGESTSRGRPDYVRFNSAMRTRPRSVSASSTS